MSIFKGPFQDRVMRSRRLPLPEGAAEGTRLGARFRGIPELDFIEKYPASPSRLDVKDWFLPEDFVGPFKGEPEASEVSECTPAFPHVGPVEQLEAV